MATSLAELQPIATQVHTTGDELVVELADGRRIAVPLVWFPRLLHATPDQRSNFEFIGDGEGVRWPDVDEDISVRGLLLGLPSIEFQKKHKSRA